MEIRQDYDEKNDILFFHWGGKGGTEYSEEYKTHDGQEFVLDFDKNRKIVGIEIFDLKKGIEPLKKHKNV